MFFSAKEIPHGLVGSKGGLAGSGGQGEEEDNDKDVSINVNAVLGWGVWRRGKAGEAWGSVVNWKTAAV